jgi:CBS domain-containing protein
MKPLDASSCCTPRDTVMHAARTMRESDCGCVAVVADADDHTLVGVLTERDVCCRVAAEDLRASDVRVDQVMRTPSACCRADDSLEDARLMLHSHSATSLPVVDGGGRCCGTVDSQHLTRTPASLHHTGQT